MEDKMSNSYLTTMVGKEVKAYKSGPESWHGLLLAVKSDYFVLFNKKDGFIYHRTNHLKSVVEDTKGHMLETSNDKLEHHGKGEKHFEDILGELVGENVKINLGGPESRKGTLLAVNDDYLALDANKDGVIYYNLEHVKSVSVKDEDKDKGHGEKNDDEKTDDTKNDHEMEEQQIPDFIDVGSLNRLLKQLKYSYIMINRGPESVEGILVDVKDNLITLVFQDQVLRVNKNHVKSIREKTQSSSNNSNSNSQNSSESIVSAKKRIQDRKKKR